MDRKESELRDKAQVTAEAVSEERSPRAERPAVSSSPTPTLQKTDELLQQGEELYAMGMYEHAIHVWTRILFLDKSDALAKRAIERAKRTLSERQRVLDEELALAASLIERGELAAATAKLHSVLSADPRNSEGHQLVGRIAQKKRRPDAGQPPVVAEAEASEDLPAAKRGLLLRVSHSSRPGYQPGQPRTSGSRLKMAGFVLGAILVFASGALYLNLNWESIVSDGAFVTVGGLAGGSREPEPAYVPGPSELRYYNGARLFDKGRYREALAELSLVGSDVAVAERARGLILRIEERLLRGASESGPGSADSSGLLGPSDDEAVERAR